MATFTRNLLFFLGVCSLFIYPQEVFGSDLISQTTNSANKVVKEVANVIEDETKKAEDKIIESTHQVVEESEEIATRSMDQAAEVVDQLASHSENSITEVTSNVLKQVVETPKKIVETPNITIEKPTERKNRSLEDLKEIAKSKKETSNIPSTIHETISMKQGNSKDNQVGNKTTSDQKPSNKTSAPPYPSAITIQTKSPGRGLGGHQNSSDYGTGLHILNEGNPLLPKTGAVMSMTTICYFFDQWLHAPPSPPPELPPSNPNVY